jgi:hypothetical protein
MTSCPQASCLSRMHHRDIPDQVIHRSPVLTMKGMRSGEEVFSGEK